MSLPFEGAGAMGALLLVVLILVLIAAVSAMLSLYLRQQRNKNPKAIAKRRYAKGEIDKDQYERILEDLDKAE